MLRHGAIWMTLIAALALAGCEGKDTFLIGKWSGGDNRFEFRKDGTFTRWKGSTEQEGTWQLAGTYLLLTHDENEVACGFLTYKNQMVLQHDTGELQSCDISALYWRLDPPADKRTSMVSWTCKTQGETLGGIAYTPTYKIEGDKDDDLACFGRTKDGCAFVIPVNISDEHFRARVSQQDGGSDLTLYQNDSGGFDLKQSTFGSCSAAGSTGVASCERQNEYVVGSCVRQ